jgi:hypothetical protein
MPCTLAETRLQWPRRVQSPAGWISADQPSALTQTDGAGSLLSLARIDAAEAVQVKGFGSALCSAT